LHTGFDGKELVFTMVYALVMSDQQERAVGILEQHLSNGSQLKQAVVLQALRNIGTQRAIGLIQKYQEKGDYHNLAENTLADQDMPVLSEIYARWNLVPPEAAREKTCCRSYKEAAACEKPSLLTGWATFPPIPIRGWSAQRCRL